jgi:hypothetical protein
MTTIGEVDIAEGFSGIEGLVVFETSPQAGESLERIQGEFKGSEYLKFPAAAQGISVVGISSTLTP